MKIRVKVKAAEIQTATGTFKRGALTTMNENDAAALIECGAIEVVKHG